DAARRRYVALFARRRALMAEELARIPHLLWEPPDGAFYFFVDVSHYGDSLALCQRILERRGVITVPGEAFGREGAGFVRMSFAAGEAQIVEGLARIRQELAGA
ncbi:MAG TPA: aminotransferase class I/II-fold pyridoxal phosphate-dependent enzyme, partial [Candidatus Polarisedimenticolaceae bacterium]|nr:aminotransferase class I/II-fold pyridoxal phosphate-dependent enzyme [Candidatus Polarisedimenticolaceae bacterium]